MTYSHMFGNWLTGINVGLRKPFFGLGGGGAIYVGLFG